MILASTAIVATTDIGCPIYGDASGQATPIPSTTVNSRFIGGACRGILHSIDFDKLLAYVKPMIPGDKMTIDYSTTYENSTGLNRIVSTNIGKVFRTCAVATTGGSSGSTAYMKERFIDPSTYSLAIDGSSGFNFRLVSFSTVNKTVDVIFVSTGTSV
jgi:hypothetical protein